MLTDIVGNIFIGDPEARQFCFASEHNCLVTVAGGRAVFTPAHGQIDFRISGTPRLFPKSFGKMIRITKSMAMNVDQGNVVPKSVNI